MGVNKSPVAWLVFLVIILTGCINDDNTDGNSESIVNVGDAVPSFMLTSADGGEVSSASLEGQVYMLSFFDTGCPDCQKEFPVLQQIYDKYGEKVPVLNVPRSQSVAEVEEYWNKEKLTMPFHTASDKSLYYKFAKSGIPRTYIVDGMGKVCAVLTDNPLADYSTIDNLLQSLLGDETPPAKANISFRMKVPTPNPGADYFQNEYIISHLELFFFDAETKKLATKLVVEDLVEDTEYPESYYDITYIMSPKHVKVGLYNIFAIANYVHTPEDIEDQDDFLNMIDSITYHSGIEPNIPSTGPVMTSDAKALLSIDLVPWEGKNYSMTIEMERVLAKLQIGVKSNSFELKHDGAKYADINITNYKLVNLNRQYYLFQHP